MSGCSSDSARANAAQDQVRNERGGERDTRVWEGASEQSEKQVGPYRTTSMGLLQTDDAY